VLSWLKRLFSRPAPAPVRTSRNVRAKYDAAQTSDENRRHWANADGLSASAANSAGVRRTLRNRSRYEGDNNGYCGGIYRTLADDLSGTGPTLQILTEDDGLSDQVEMAWKGWCKAVGLGEKLWTMAQAKARDGEAFAVLFNNPGHGDPVQLDLRPVEADQVADPYGMEFPRSSSNDGVDYDAYGNPVRYRVLREHPGDLLRAYPIEYDTLPAASVIHWFRKDRPGQLRGVPELMASLPLFAQQRRWTLATLTAAEVAASFAATLETEMPPDGETDDPTPFETLEIERGMMTTLPAGSRMHQFAATQPTTTYPDFKREVIAEAGRPVMMPVNVVAGDSSRHNFSSAKLDHFNYRGSLKVARAFAAQSVLEPLFRAWFAEARLVPGLLPEGLSLASLPRAWHWPGWPSMDKDEATNDTERLANNTATLAELLAEWGLDWRQVLQQRGREVALAKKLGLVPEPPAPAPDLGKPPQKPVKAGAARDVRAYDPDQPRDGHGRFGETGDEEADGREEQALEDRHDEEDSRIRRGREKEDERTERRRDKEDNRVLEKRDEEDSRAEDRAERQAEREGLRRSAAAEREADRADARRQEARQEKGKDSEEYRRAAKEAEEKYQAYREARERHTAEARREAENRAKPEREAAERRRAAEDAERVERRAAEDAERVERRAVEDRANAERWERERQELHDRRERAEASAARHRTNGRAHV
jgi:capsid protein